MNYTDEMPPVGILPVGSVDPFSPNPHECPNCGAEVGDWEIACRACGYGLNEPVQHEIPIWLENWPNSNCDFWVFHGNDNTRLGTLHILKAINKWSFVPVTPGTQVSAMKGELNGSLHDVKVLEKIRKEIVTWFSQAMLPYFETLYPRK